MSDAPDDAPDDGEQARGDGADESRRGDDASTVHDLGETPPGGRDESSPDLWDIFSRPETVDEMVVGTALYALVAIGFGVAGIGFSTVSAGPGGFSLGNLGLGVAFGGGVAVLGLVAMAPLLALVVGLRQAEALEAQPDKLAYATAATTAFGGTVLAYVLTVFFVIIAVGDTIVIGPLISQLLGPVIVLGAGAALVCTGAVWIAWNDLRAVASSLSQTAEESL